LGGALTRIFVQDRKFEDRETQKTKRGRRSAMPVEPGPTRGRASGRVTRQTASRNKRSQGKDSLLEQDDDDTLSVTTDGYDIFRDPPKPSPSKSRLATL